MWGALTTRVPLEEVRRIVRAAAAEEAPGGCEEAIGRYALLDGPVETVMGGRDFWDFGRDSGGATGGRPWGKLRALSNLRAWLTSVSNETVYQVQYAAAPPRQSQPSCTASLSLFFIHRPPGLPRLAHRRAVALRPLPQALPDGEQVDGAR